VILFGASLLRWLADSELYLREPSFPIFVPMEEAVLVKYNNEL